MGTSKKNNSNANNSNTVGLNVISLKDWIKSHPAQSAGYGLTGVMNIGGLLDDDKILGQLGGAAGGYGIAKIPAVSAYLNSKGIDPTLVAMTGGALGSLFDKLRTQKEEEYNQYRTY